ncbi:MAG: glycerophosphodiester phosphodiesterase family protein [Bacteroidota bacterium]
MMKYNLLILVLSLFLLPSCLFLRPDRSTAPLGDHYIQETGKVKRILAPISAHRGGRAIVGYPENALETFAYMQSRIHTMIECDVRMTADSVLILMHDQTIDRTTNGVGKVSEMNWEELESLYLKDDFGTMTSFRIPLLKDALEWGKGKVVFTLDVKRGVPYERVIQAVEAAQAEAWNLIITYNFQDAKKVYDLAPDMLLSVSIRSQEELERFTASGIPEENIMAFVGTSEPDPSLYEALHARGVLCILGTLGNLDRRVAAKTEDLYKDFMQRGADILATDRPLAANMGIKGVELRAFTKEKIRN